MGPGLSKSPGARELALDRMEAIAFKADQIIKQPTVTDGPTVTKGLTTTEIKEHRTTKEPEGPCSHGAFGYTQPECRAGES